MQDPTGADTASRFSDQAEAYATSETHAYGADLDIVAAYAEPGQYHLCLDIGCGPGHTAFRIASKASVVVGVDIAQGMLTKARQLAADHEIHNVVFQYADAAALPFQEASFDLVTCRTAAHHFEDIPAFLAEAARVLRPDGRLVLDDTVSPEEPEIASVLLELERLRDPSHVRALSPSEWRQAVEAAGLSVLRDTVFETLHPFEPWVERTRTPAEARAAISTLIEGAPEAARQRLFTMEGDAPSHLHLDKMVLRAEPA